MHSRAGVVGCSRTLCRWILRVLRLLLSLLLRHFTSFYFMSRVGLTAEMCGSLFGRGPGERNAARG